MSVIDRLPDLQLRIQMLNQEAREEREALLKANQQNEEQRLFAWQAMSKDLIEKASSLTIVDQTFADIQDYITKQDKVLKHDAFAFMRQEPTWAFGLAGEINKDKTPTLQWLLLWNDTRFRLKDAKTIDDVSVGYGKHYVEVTLDLNKCLTIQGKEKRVVPIYDDPAEIEALIGMAYLEPGKRLVEVETSHGVGKLPGFFSLQT